MYEQAEIDTINAWAHVLQGVGSMSERMQQHAIAVAITDIAKKELEIISNT